MNAKLLIPFAIALLVGVVWFVTRHKKTTRIDASGVLFIRSPASPLFLPWSEIEGFGIASVCQIEGGLYEPGFTQCLGVRLESSSPKKESKACRDNRRLSDYDMLFSPDSGTSLADFATHLENEKAKFKKG